MEEKLPGREAVETLRLYPHVVERGEITPPAQGLIRGTPNGNECIIPLEIVTNVVPVGAGGEGPPMVELRILVCADQQWSVKTGKDAKGKPVFLRSLND